MRRDVFIDNDSGGFSVVAADAVDEPLQADEEAQWLARASWYLDTADGRSW